MAITGVDEEERKMRGRRKEQGDGRGLYRGAVNAGDEEMKDIKKI